MPGRRRAVSRLLPGRGGSRGQKHPHHGAVSSGLSRRQLSPRLHGWRWRARSRQPQASVRSPGERGDQPRSRARAHDRRRLSLRGGEPARAGQWVEHSLSAGHEQAPESVVCPGVGQSGRQPQRLCGNAPPVGREARIHRQPGIPQRRISRLQRRDRSREVPRPDAASGTTARRQFPSECQLHLVAHHRQREFHDLHQSAAEPIRQQIGGGRFESGCSPPVCREFQRDRAREECPPKRRGERHRDSAVRASLHHLRRR